ncbi:hypothetical protein COY05_03890 [Candidatus Peregrinibacteria bacterium CG_4_10_14_0_2_um_filter_38_24]|nr:MAG: hypothetical protein COY05_03890 [Candidatus Peregrinibacteria bacterium CG_4_10_14_0_2_um_filter_38_24]PJC39272.1 MAG: hypothetical protein CO044_00690 [Candidatus Peregrinibacteria bacterium CG_4_9_14_0_2_um_filter_38_9]
MQYPKEKLDALRKRWTTAKGKKLVASIKRTHCYLNPALFREKVKGLEGINDPELENGIDMRGISVSGFDFRISVQEDDGFSENLAILANIHFEGAMLRYCNFQEGKIHDCNFENAELSHSDFKNAHITDCSFQNSDLNEINLINANITNCSLVDANIDDISTSGTVIDEKSNFGKELKSETAKNYHSAAIEYKQIKEMYKYSSLHEQADEFHYREMISKRKRISYLNPVRFFSYIFGDLLCKYGTSFIRVFMAAILVVITCTFAFQIFDSLMFYNEKLTDYSFLDALYFSITTFTTLGYGDYHAVGAVRFIAAAESFVGIALTSLFTVIVARSIIRD